MQVSFEQALESLSRIGEESAARRKAFESRFQQSAQGKVCGKHGVMQAPDPEASWRHTVRNMRDTIIHAPCPQCQSEDVERAIQSRLIGMGVPVALAHCSFKNYVPECKRETVAFEKLQAWSKEPKGAVLFYGNVGAGKSHLMVSVLRENTGRYRTHDELIGEVRSGYGSTPAHYAGQREADKTMRCPLLIWDEFGLGGSGNDSSEIIHRVLSHRYDSKLPTLIAFNGELQPFKILIGDRLESRLREWFWCDPLLLDGRDHRRKV